jgi:PKD repeat protein
MLRSRRSGLRLRRGHGSRIGARGILIALLVPGMLRAQWAEPVRLTNGSGSATHATLTLDTGNIAFVVSVVNEMLQVDLIGPNLRSTVELPDARPGQGEPSIVTSSLGLSWLVFSQTDPDPANLGREIFLTNNNGGSFRPPFNISKSRADDHAPRLALDNLGNPHVVWAQSLGDSGDSRRILHFVLPVSGGSGRTTEVANGSYPVLHVDPTRVVHVVYTRDNDLFYNHNRTGDFNNEERIVNTPSQAEFDAHIGVDLSGRVFVAYESQGSLYMTTRPAGQRFLPPRLLDTGIVDPELRLRTSGTVSLVYSKHGEIYYIQGLSTFLLAPNRIGLQAPEIATRPRLLVDGCGTSHAVFLRRGDVYYTNNFQEIDADFTATPRSGEVPLAVQFQDISTGKVQRRLWDFGDGAQSALGQPTHVYTQPGKYTVRYTIFSNDRDSFEEKTDFIIVEEPFHTMSISDQAVVPGQKGVWFPVVAGHRDPIQGFQIMATFDPNILLMRECSLRATATLGMNPELFVCNILPRPEEGLGPPRRVEIGCIFDLHEPYDHTTLFPGDHHTLVNLVFDVTDYASPGAVTEVELVNNSEISRIYNIFTVDGFSRLPVLRSGRVEVLDPSEAGGFFVRGDVNGNGTVEISDAIMILNYLFTGGAAPICPDAADVNDRGRIDISAPINLLNFLFLGAAPPAVPFPGRGLDPTPDSLPPCP